MFFFKEEDGIRDSHTRFFQIGFSPASISNLECNARIWIQCWRLIQIRFQHQDSFSNLETDLLIILIGRTQAYSFAIELVGTISIHYRKRYHFDVQERLALRGHTSSLFPSEDHRP